MTFKEKKRGSFSIIYVILFLILIGGGYVVLSPQFEQNKPQITLEDNIYWNLRDNLKIDIKDQTGIKYYRITFKDNSREIELQSRVLIVPEQKLTLQVAPPKFDMFYKGTDIEIVVEAIDNSKWNFLDGNRAIKSFQMKIDTKKPIANIIANSRYIQRGGSAVVVANIKDANIKEAYISFNDQKKFSLQPFYKDNYFVSLIAWPMPIEKFKRVNLVVTDKAGNKTITKVPLYIQEKRVKADKIIIDENFVKNVSASVLEQSFEKVPDNIKDIFIYSNKNLRDKNIATIEKVTSKALEGKVINNFSIYPFKRLRGSKTVANYGEFRQYYLDGEMINEAWHLGIDWASVKRATVRTSNSGEVIFKDYLGLYGNAIIIDHGMGLCSLYAHTSSQDVVVGQKVSKKQKIANTGATGAVFGDHLHFGIIVQGVEVNPIEWMDRNWIKTRITNILEKSKKQIDRKI